MAYLARNNLTVAIHSHNTTWQADGTESFPSALQGEGLWYWSASNTGGCRIPQYEAEAKAIDKKLGALICMCDKGRAECRIVIKLLTLQGCGIEHDRFTLIEAQMDFSHLSNLDERVHAPRGYDRSHAAVKCKEKMCLCYVAMLCLSEIQHTSVALSFVQYDIKWQGLIS